MSTVIDSQIFGNIFATSEVAAIWSDRQRTEYYLQFEAALAKAQAELGIIPQKACDEIVKHCTLEHLDFDELRKQTELIGYPVLPVVQQLVKKINTVEDRLGEWTHWGTTTQDVTDTATVLQLRDTIILVEKSLDAIIAALMSLCEKHKSTPMAARSNLQQAVPISFGFKMARLLATFQRHKLRLQDLKPRLLVSQFSGAAGTLATITPETSYTTAPPPAPSSTPVPLALRCQTLLSKHLNLPPPLIAWHTEHDAFAELTSHLSLLTATCSKFTTDLSLLSQTEVSEAREPYIPHRGSSSTMPQKRNPIDCAYIHSLSSSIRSMNTGMLSSIATADHERSTGPWETEWILLPQICILSHACLTKTAYLLHGVEVDADAMARNLEISRGGIVSEAVMMGLGKKLGRQYAHDLVYELCRKAQMEDKGLEEVLLENEEIRKAGLGREEVRRLCDPGEYLGLSEVMTERVLESVRAEQARGG